MKSKCSFARLFGVLVAAVFLAGCATKQDAEHSEHHPATDASGAQMAAMDMKVMCDMHKKMMSTKTPAERQVMMDEHAKSMSPEMMKKHMAVMEKCK